MATTGAERYRQHQVWEVLTLKRDALASVRYSTAALEECRVQILGALEHALRSRKNTSPYLYDDVLDNLRDVLNSLAGDEASFSNFLSYQAPAMKEAIRRLPGPPPQQVNDKYVQVLDSAISAREIELDELRKNVRSVETAIAERQKELAKLSAAVTRQTEKITADAATVAQVTASAEEQLKREWQTRLEVWDTVRDTTDKRLDEEMSEHLMLLATAATAGQRLVEHAAGQLTATEWTRRATRERRNAIWLRWASIAAFLLAVVAGGYIVWHAIDRGFTLTVGDGILRGAIVIALVGIGSFLTIEARRHFKEADSAEEVALALTAIEPFYAGADTTARSTARDAVGETVFVRNVLSRFSSRDASKHTSVSNQQLSEIMDLLTKGTEMARKSDAAGS